MLKNAALFIRAHTPVKREDIECRRIQFVGKFPRQILDVAFRRQKAKQMVAVARFQIENRIAGLVEQAGVTLAASVAVSQVWILRLRASRSAQDDTTPSSEIVFYVHRECAAFRFHHAAVVVKFFKKLCI